jgi:hypothetical protein
LFDSSRFLSLAKGLPFCFSSQRTNSLFHWSCILVLNLHFLDFCSNLHDTFLPINLGFDLFFFLNLGSWDSVIGVFIWNLSTFLDTDCSTSLWVLLLLYYVCGCPFWLHIWLPNISSTCLWLISLRHYFKWIPNISCIQFAANNRVSFFFMVEYICIFMYIYVYICIHILKIYITFSLSINPSNGI